MATRRNGPLSTYTEEIAAALEDWVANGEPLKAFCRQPGMPKWRTVYSWMEKRPEFAARIARAREVGADAIAESILEIADTPQLGERVEESDDGRKVTTEDMLGHRKLRTWARLQLLAKWFPAKYGDRTAIEHSGRVSLEQLVAGSMPEG